MTAPERARAWRQQRTALGLCHRCPRPARGYLCESCKRETAGYFAGKMRTARLGMEFLTLMVLLAEGKCPLCQQPKRWFHPIAHRRCRQMLKNA